MRTLYTIACRFSNNKHILLALTVAEGPGAEYRPARGRIEAGVVHGRRVSGADADHVALLQSELLHVGRRQTFDKMKVLNGMIKACEKRPVALAELQRAAVAAVHEDLFDHPQNVVIFPGLFRFQIPEMNTIIMVTISTQTDIMIQTIQILKEKK